jgi:hypothetical protein
MGIRAGSTWTLITSPFVKPPAKTPSYRLTPMKRHAGAPSTARGVTLIGDTRIFLKTWRARSGSSSKYSDHVAHCDRPRREPRPTWGQRHRDNVDGFRACSQASRVAEGDRASNLASARPLAFRPPSPRAPERAPKESLRRPRASSLLSATGWFNSRPNTDCRGYTLTGSWPMPVA